MLDMPSPGSFQIETFKSDRKMAETISNYVVQVR